MKPFYVAAMGEADGVIMAAIGARMAAEFGTPVRQLQFPAPEFAYNPERNQYGSIPVLELLLRHCPPEARKLLAVTERDLFIPALTFVYGQAQLNGRVALMSLARLRQEFYGMPPNPAVTRDRAIKEALHEVGHTFGLVHCADAACAMRLSTNIRQIDTKKAIFCADCEAQLRRAPRE